MTPQAASHADPEDRPTPSRSDWVAVDAATIPAKLARELRDAWEGFVDGHTLDRSEDEGTPPIRNPIAASWRRSRDAGVDPHGRQNAPSLMELPGARASWTAHPLAIAAPLIDECMSAAAVDADHLMVISDASGMLLSIRGDVTLRSRAADEMNFVEGALWSEAGAGTNAVGTALAAEHAVQVFAAEHFTEPVQRWTCAAAPISDPDTGKLLGVIDLTGDMSSVHPHSLSVVVATARAVEQLLRMQLREADEQLRSRYAAQLHPAGAALVTAAGRVIADPRGLLPDIGAIPPGGGRIVLPSGTEVVAEPVAHDAPELFLVHDGATRRRTVTLPRPQLELRLLGDGQAGVRLDGVALRLRPRLVELLALLMLHRGRAGAEALCPELYGAAGHPGSVRVEMSRLRKLLPGAIEPGGYALICDVDADVKHVREALGRGAVGEAAAAYPGSLLPASQAPGIVSARKELDHWLRQAVITSDDPDALWAWVSAPAGSDDLLAWQRLLGALEYTDARRSLAAARVGDLRHRAAADAPSSEL
ncbi:GAF domain-containing protein [Conexibacter woesei]|uniref:GAF domain-containing protein n=1 Tax=Conexibacter woesei TaxID=191495 RepID=UPI0004279317|nr:GAF domain-containing protein [Conexibacter woesei]